MVLFRVLAFSSALALEGLRTQHDNDNVQVCVEEYANGLDLVRKDLGQSARELSRLRPRRTSRKEMLFNVGPGTTGTHYVDELLENASVPGYHFSKKWEVHEALYEILGRCYPTPWKDCMHLSEKWKDHDSPPDHVRRECYTQLRNFDFTAVGEYSDQVSDSPFPELFVHLYRAYPNAKFILSTRPAHEWAEKRLSGHHSTFATIQEPCGQFVHQFTVNETEQLFNLHNSLVRCVVPQSRLIEMDIFRHPEKMEEYPERMEVFIHDQSRFPASKRCLDSEYRVNTLVWINRNDSLDRAAGMEKQFKDPSLIDPCMTIVRIEAVTPEMVLANMTNYSEFYSGMCNHEGGWLGQKAGMCANDLSHRIAYKKCMHTRGYCMVLEDDAVLTPGWHEEYVEAVKSLPSRWRMMRLAPYCVRHEEHRLQETKWMQGSRDETNGDLCYGSNGTVVNRKRARKLLHKLQDQPAITGDHNTGDKTSFIYEKNIVQKSGAASTLRRVGTSGAPSPVPFRRFEFFS